MERINMKPPKWKFGETTDISRKALSSGLSFQADSGLGSFWNIGLY
jgi:hypothetical protein